MAKAKEEILELFRKKFPDLVDTDIYTDIQS